MKSFTDNILIRNLAMPIIFCLFILSYGCLQNKREVEQTPEIVEDISTYSRFTRNMLPDSLVGKITDLCDNARTEGDLNTYGISSMILATRNVCSKNYQAAISVMENYIGHIKNATTDSTILYKAYYRMGEFYYLNGISWIALDNFIKAGEYATTNREQSRILYAIGISSDNSHEASRGIDSSEYFRQAEKLARQQNDSVMIALSLFGRAGGYVDFLGVHRFKDEQLAIAKKDSINTAIELLEEAGRYSSSTDVVNYALGLSHAALKDFDKARSYIYKDTTNIPGCQDMNVRASLLICEGDYTGAVAQATRAKNLGEVNNNENDIRNSLHLLYCAYKNSGDIPKALQAFEKFIELRQKLMDESFRQQVNISQVRYDTKLKEERLASSENENRLYRQGLVIISCALFIIILLLGVVWVYYRKTRKAHHELVEKSLKWAANYQNKPQHINNIEKNKTGGNELELVAKLDNLLTEEKLYLNPELTLNEMAERLGTNRTYLSGSINRHFGDNFTQHLNEYRIREAVNIMSDPATDVYTVDMLASMVGFSNRNTFHRSFVKVTGLSPSEFRRNRII